MLSAGHRQIFLACTALLMLLAIVSMPAWHPFLPQARLDYPDQLVLPLARWLGDFLNWLAREAMLGPVKISQITRATARIVDMPMNALNVLLTTGWRSGFGENVVTIVPPLGWFTVLAISGALGWRLGGWRLGLSAAFGLLYVAAFGLWADAMMTLSSVLISTVAAIILGLAIGTAALHNRATDRAVAIAMNVMQTVPVFAYLVPTLLFLGYGPSAAFAATVIYALPPMVHATILGLKSVPTEALELGVMTGASRSQTYWKIKLPLAMPIIVIGINQAVMACLNMVIVASMIGSGGLGYVVLTMLRKLDIGHALEAGLAIVVLAVILDRFCQAMARHLISASPTSSLRWPVKRSTAISLLILSLAATWVIPALQTWPADSYLTTAPMWNGLVTWMNIHLFDVLDGIRTFALLNVMNPTKNFLLALPWSLVVTFLTAWGLWLGGPRCGALVAGLCFFVVVTGYWQPAVVSVYLVSLGAVLSLLIGVPVGYWFARHESWRPGAELFLDTLQTLPTLVYLLPAVMLFRNGDFSAVLAITSYAVAPAVRYAMHSFAHVSESRLELARMSGASPSQTLRWIRLPEAFPTLLLGINQTVMMAIAMLVITALVGTRDLGQQVFIALSRMRVGDGMVAGLAVAAIALAADSLMRAAARNAAASVGVRL
ncbi:ABC transporter permease subunit [Mesorhizobium sp. CA8]|uniref:ABC transporter permease n=1 Tax=unclassified Mesorhizobium TaxID=325217 RepID=UPI001CCBF243|nr:MULTISPECIES: ABC transporter permease subunit [unclassified Mesorhizobium]MBZ9761653.1 ABC transporter permease subunit [Mesorhizobium sp. CA8]MBZ9820593.1 ABC transporter permease subunit [Mesorhizobium sp. CA4]